MSLQQLEQRARTRADARQQMSQTVYEYVRAHPGCTHAQVAQATGAPLTKISMWATPELAATLCHEPDEWQGLESDLDLIQALRQVSVQLGRVPSQALYSAHRSAQMPTAAKLNARFGSWSAAVQMAGMQPAFTTSADLQQLRAAVEHFVADGGRSQMQYVQWAKTHQGPSLSWIVQKLGPWSALIKQVSP